MLSLLAKGKFYPFPPFYSSGLFIFSTPLFITPTVLFLFVSVVGLYRYLKTKSVPWQDISSPLVTPNRRLSPLSRLIVALSCLVTVTFLLDTVVVVTRVILDEGSISVMLLYYIAFSWFAWVISLVCLIDESHKFSKWYWLQYTFYAMAVTGETCVAWLWASSVYNPRPGSIFTIYDNILLGIFIARYVIEFTTFILSLIQMMTSKRYTQLSETSPLINSASNYGAIDGDERITTSKKDENRSGYHDFWNKLRKVMPYIWPKDDRYLQQLVLLCFILMCLGLLVNVYTPLQIGKIVDQFKKEPSSFAWAAVLAYVGLKFLQGGSGLIQAIQNWFWIPIGQFTTREVSVKLFAHLHSLSLQYHINRKTGEVLRVVDRGTNSIVQLLSQIVFQIFPALANIFVAVIVFSFKFSPAFGLIVFTTMSLYLYTTITLTEWRNSFRRKMNELDNFARTKAVDSLLNFETVKYYNAEGFEVDRYHKAIVEYQKADYVNSVSLNVLNLAQNAVITGGLLAGSLLFAYEVSRNRLTAGDFVTFNVYMMQLYTPLHFFGTYYRMIQQNFIDMEKMFDLFEEEETVKDVEGAEELVVKDGLVKFDNVSFAYDNRQTALNGISFSIPKGATVALVGPSGGGKSTILRLLFRFYDPNAGHIYIDNQDISRVKQTSLRKNIGVVPQDTVLFNDTILYNIRYGDVNASDEDVYNAAKAAQIHDKILSFPDGYNTKVGERGLRLSGGEKQRVAIARTILKNPPIILLDEATSALDTTTERYIQEALSEMTKDRTTLVIAHRLSTIVNSDLILVIKEGKVVEAGSHDELIQSALARQNEGVYYEMWQKQLDDHHDSTSQTATGDMTPKPIEEVAPTPAPKPEPSNTTQNDATSTTTDELESKQSFFINAHDEVVPITTEPSTQSTEEIVEEDNELKQPLQEQLDVKEVEEQEESQGLKINTNVDIEEATTSSAHSSGTESNSSKVVKDREMTMTPVENNSPVENNAPQPTASTSKTTRSRNKKKNKRKGSRK